MSMSQLPQGTKFVCQRCRTSGFAQSRTFTTTRLQQRTIPTFTETPSEELNSILFEFRDKVFKPVALSKTHERLIYKKSRHHILRNDPGVSVTLGNNEEIKLEPMERWDRPNKYKSLYQIARIMGQGNDIRVWENLPNLLEGLVLAKEKIPVDFLEKITRKANEAGRAGLIRRCAEVADKTGMRLSIQPVTRELFLGIYSQGVNNKFDDSEIYGALEFLTNLMEKEEHCAGRLRSGEKDMRSDPLVLAVKLALDAAKARSVHKGEDINGKVTASAQRLLKLAKDTTNILRREDKANACQAVEDWVPIATGLRMALRTGGLAGAEKDVDSKLRTSLKSLLDTVNQAIESEVKVVKEEAKGKPRRALKMLEEANKLA